MAKRTLKAAPVSAPPEGDPEAETPNIPTPEQQAANMLDSPEKPEIVEVAKEKPADIVDSVGAEIEEVVIPSPVETHSAPIVQSDQLGTVAAEIASNPPAVPFSAEVAAIQESTEQIDERKQAELRAERAWKRALSEAKDNYIEAAIHRKHCEGELKSAKETEKGALEIVQKLIDRGPEKLPLFDKQPEKQAVAASVKPESSTAGSSPSNSSDNGWRSIAITELTLSTIEGLGTGKKLTALIDACPTLGHIEDARVAAGINGLQSAMPKGIGQKVTDQLEELHLNFITKWNNERQITPAVSEQPASESAPAESATAADASTAPAPESFYPSITEWELWSEEKQDDYLRARAAGISESGSLSPELVDTRYWEEGRTAYEEGDEVINCPYTPGEFQDDYFRGYFSAAAADLSIPEGEESEESGDQEPTSPEESDNPPAEGQPGEEPELATAGAQAATGPQLFSLDDI